MRGRRVAVALSGGMDSVVLLHLLHALEPRLGCKLSAIHVNHGLSQNAGDWQRFCSAYCLELGVPFKALKVKVTKHGHGLEAAAREARRAAFAKLRVDAIALAHHLDDQAETVLFNLLRGAGLEGASGMPVQGKLGRKALLRRIGLRGLDPGLFDRPKRGFVLPFDRWLRRGLRKEMDETFRDVRAVQSAGLDPEAVGRVWRTFLDDSPGMYWSRVWALYVLIRWTQHNRVFL